MKKKIWIIALAVIVLVVILMLTGAFGRKTAGTVYETALVKKGTITNTVTATGTIQAETSVDVGTQVSGIIDKVYVDFNDEVRQGQLLAEIDKKQLTAQLEQSDATLEQAKAQLTYQEATFNRLKALYEKQLIAQADYDQALYNYQNAKASLKNAQSAYDRNLVQLNYCTIYSPISGVVLNRAVEEGQTVAASFSTPTLFTIVNDLTQMKVETSVDEADIGKVKQGQRVGFTVDAYPEMTFEGRVSEVRLQPVTTNNVVTYSVILSAPNPDKKLMPGMTASATIYVEEKADVLIIPGRALRFTPDDRIIMEAVRSMIPAGMPPFSGGQGGFPPQGFSPDSMGTGFSRSGTAQAMLTAFSNMGGENAKIVWTYNNDSIRLARVMTGIDNGTEVEIVSGLNEGDKVILSVAESMDEQESSGGFFGNMEPPEGQGPPF